jgi:hypothetical protein
MSPPTQTPKVFAAHPAETIFQTGEGMKETTTKIKEIKTKYIYKKKEEDGPDKKKSHSSSWLVPLFS